MERLMDTYYNCDFNPSARFSLALFDAFKDSINATYDYKVVDTWSLDSGDGSWTGSMGLLQNQTSEFSLQVHKYRKERYNFTDVGVPLAVGRLMIVYLQPKIFDSYKALIIPLNREVWYCVGALLLVFMVSFMFMGRFDKSQNLENFGAILLLTLGTLAQQDFNDQTRFSSSRLLCFTLLLLSFSCCLYYNAAIINFLLSPTPHTIKTLQQLLDSHFTLGVLDAPYLKDFYSYESLYGSLDEETRKLIAKMREEPKLFYSLEEGVAKVKEGGFAFIADDSTAMRTIINQLTDLEICLTYIIDKYTYQKGVALKKNSPYKELLNRKLIWMWEVGLRERAVNTWLLGLPDCQWQQEAINIGMEAVTVAFVVLVVGFFLSILIFVCELLTYQKAQHQSIFKTIINKMA